jgi:hypothetical protein
MVVEKSGHNINHHANLITTVKFWSFRMSFSHVNAEVDKRVVWDTDLDKALSPFSHILSSAQFIININII